MSQIYTVHADISQQIQVSVNEQVLGLFNLIFSLNVSFTFIIQPVICMLIFNKKKKNLPQTLP